MEQFVKQRPQQPVFVHNYALPNLIHPGMTGSIFPTLKMVVCRTVALPAGFAGLPTPFEILVPSIPMQVSFNSRARGADKNMLQSFRVTDWEWGWNVS